MVECDENQASEVAKILQEKMENIAPDFKVKLATDVKIANNWGEL
jgi:DNA polymerase I-like protein with 3'-5' exonuclease and polymerase domains